MRISDWSSDVCSSDLLVEIFAGHVKDKLMVQAACAKGDKTRADEGAFLVAFNERAQDLRHFLQQRRRRLIDEREIACNAAALQPRQVRSEEHTSELQSPMYISHAASCV